MYPETYPAKKLPLEKYKKIDKAKREEFLNSLLEPLLKKCEKFYKSKNKLAGIDERVLNNLNTDCFYQFALEDLVKEVLHHTDNSSIEIFISSRSPHCTKATDPKKYHQELYKNITSISDRIYICKTKTPAHLKYFGAFADFACFIINHKDKYAEQNNVHDVKISHKTLDKWRQSHKMLKEDKDYLTKLISTQTTPPKKTLDRKKGQLEVIFSFTINEVATPQERQQVAIALFSLAMATAIADNKFHKNEQEILEDLKNVTLKKKGLKLPQSTEQIIDKIYKNPLSIEQSIQMLKELPLNLKTNNLTEIFFLIAHCDDDFAEEEKNFLALIKNSIIK